MQTLLDVKRTRAYLIAKEMLDKNLLAVQGRGLKKFIICLKNRKQQLQHQSVLAAVFVYEMKMSVMSLIKIQILQKA